MQYNHNPTTITMNTTMTTQRQELFLRDMLNGSSSNNNSDDSSTNNSQTPSIQLTKILSPFQLYTKKRTDINNNSVEISLLGKSTEHTSLDIQTEKSVSVYLAEEGLSSTVVCASHLIKKILPITFSSVKKNDKVSVVSCNGTRNNSKTCSVATTTTTLNSNQPPKVAFRVKSHGKGCNGTVKLFVIPFVVTDNDAAKTEEHYYLMIKAKRNSLGKGNNKYGIENAYMFRKSMDNDLIDQIIDRVQSFDASSATVTATTNTSSVTSANNKPTSRPVPQEPSSPTNKKRRVRSSSNAIQNDANKTKLRKTQLEGSVKEEKQISTVGGAPSTFVGVSSSSLAANNNNMYHKTTSLHQFQQPQQQQQYHQPHVSSTNCNPFNAQRPINNSNNTTRNSVLSQGTVPLGMEFANHTSQRLPQTSYSNTTLSSNQQSSNTLASMMANMMNNPPPTYTIDNTSWNNHTSTTNTGNSNVGNLMKNHILEMDFQKQYGRQSTFQTQQSSYQPIQYYQAPSQSTSHSNYGGDNRALKRTLDEIFCEEFATSNMHQQPQYTSNVYQNHPMMNPVQQNFVHLSTDEDIMSMQHQEMAEIIDSIQMFDMPLVNEEDEQLNFFC
ncbi:hypothetical protein C9374_009216 [Naegleria lovaniensis]|uniref:Uncharacterized protein n=1 Tax=Naegleria lovaniensis TaxID=51637 RepID=A0AA88GC00_NAELO|nr:uncharacterized protein C9374_013616 [Naegleria lovaniensis]XP_044544962.1 uncharacterized protein C9374_009216 [Naegleria lovaniensis]KAG2372715.1 hypothetical protein C9374_013616 [Naegleria lovaniensis]KAG2377700.1 hypothetical protein C9374_009216 [Naegleria lovaniensis]